MLTKILCWLFTCPAATVDIEGQTLKVDVVSGGQGIVWGMEQVSDKKVLFTTRAGQIRALNLVSGKIQTAAEAPRVVEEGQGGLLDIRRHPSRPFIYITYAKDMGDDKTTTALARADFQNDQIGVFKDIFVAKPFFETRHHYGSRIAFDDKGFLFLSVGDRGRRDLAQSLNTHNGKILRLNEDGSVPTDNPFVGQKGALAEIFSYGHRNPQGLAFIGPLKLLVAHEHGPQGGDEINRIEAGKNYGWPIITYGKEYGSGRDIGEGSAKKGMLQPLKYYVPSIAPSGLAYYGNGQIRSFQNSLLVGAMAKMHLNQVKFDAGAVGVEKRHLEDRGQRLREVQVLRDGSVLASTDDGQILRISAVKSPKNK